MERPGGLGYIFGEPVRNVMVGIDCRFNGAIFLKLDFSDYT
jgi:hypothetical protein